jgi:opacity protein-like surface antigen
MNTQSSPARRGSRLLIGFVAICLVLAVPKPAAADITVFFGVGNKPETRAARGLSLGMTLLVVGFEAEYSDISEKADKGAPRLRTGMVNAIVQTPTSGVQLYATAGAGAYREALRVGLVETRETNVGLNFGGGIKMNFFGPVKLRVDYRQFRLRGDPRFRTVNRIYAGINAGF